MDDSDREQARHGQVPRHSPDRDRVDSNESRDTAAPPSFLSVYISRRPWPVASQYQSASLAVRMPKSKRSTVATGVGLGCESRETRCTGVTVAVGCAEA